MKNMYKIGFYFSLFSLIAFSCSDDGSKFSIKHVIGFETPVGSVVEDNESGIRVRLYSNANVAEAVTVTIAVNNFQNLEYGVDFTTEPALVDGEFTLTNEPGTDLPSFFVYPGPSADGKDRQVEFQITNVEGSENVSLAYPTALSYLLTIKGPCPLTPKAVLVTNDFNACTTNFATPTGFIEAFEPDTKTDRGWGCREFGTGTPATRAVRASAFGGAAGNDRAWLIMNPVRIAVDANVSLDFYVNSSFSGPGTVTVKWSSDYLGSGNPLLATWNDLPTIDAQFPAAGSALYKRVQGSFTNICGENVYIAFVFTGGNNTASSSWDIDDLKVTVN